MELSTGRVIEDSDTQSTNATNLTGLATQKEGTTRRINIRGRTQSGSASTHSTTSHTSNSPLPSASTTSASTSVSDDGRGWIILPPTRRPDGTWRKQIRIRSGYIPPEERPIGTSIRSSNESTTTTSTNTTTHESNSKNNTEREVNIEEDEDILIDILDDDLQNTTEPTTTISSNTTTTTTASTQSSTTLASSTNTHVEKKESTLKSEEVTVEELSLSSIRSHFQSSTNSMLQEIERCRRQQGITLLNQIAKMYDIRIQILNGPEKDLVKADDEDDEEEEYLPNEPSREKRKRKRH